MSLTLYEARPSFQKMVQPVKEMEDITIDKEYDFIAGIMNLFDLLHKLISSVGEVALIEQMEWAHGKFCQNTWRR